MGSKNFKKKSAVLFPLRNLVVPILVILMTQFSSAQAASDMELLSSQTDEESIELQDSEKRKRSREVALRSDLQKSLESISQSDRTEGLDSLLLELFQKEQHSTIRHFFAYRGLGLAQTQFLAKKYVKLLINPGLKARVREGRDGVCTPPLCPAGSHPGLKAGVSLASMNSGPTSQWLPNLIQLYTSPEIYHSEMALRVLQSSDWIMDILVESLFLYFEGMEDLGKLGPKPTLRSFESEVEYQKRRHSYEQKKLQLRDQESKLRTPIIRLLQTYRYTGYLDRAGVLKSYLPHFEIEKQLAQACDEIFEGKRPVPPLILSKKMIHEINLERSSIIHSLEMNGILSRGIIVRPTELEAELDEDDKLLFWRNPVESLDLMSNQEYDKRKHETLVKWVNTMKAKLDSWIHLAQETAEQDFMVEVQKTESKAVSSADLQKKRKREIEMISAQSSQENKKIKMSQAPSRESEVKLEREVKPNRQLIQGSSSSVFQKMLLADQKFHHAEEKLVLERKKGKEWDYKAILTELLESKVLYQEGLQLSSVGSVDSKTLSDLYRKIGDVSWNISALLREANLEKSTHLKRTLKYSFERHRQLIDAKVNYREWFKVVKNIGSSGNFEFNSQMAQAKQILNTVKQELDAVEALAIHTSYDAALKLLADGNKMINRNRSEAIQKFNTASELLQDLKNHSFDSLRLNGFFSNAYTQKLIGDLHWALGQSYGDKSSFGGVNNLSEALERRKKAISHFEEALSIYQFLHESQAQLEATNLKAELQETQEFLATLKSGRAIAN